MDPRDDDWFKQAKQRWEQQKQAGEKGAEPEEAASPAPAEPAVPVQASPPVEAEAAPTAEAAPAPTAEAPPLDFEALADAPPLAFAPTAEYIPTVKPTKIPSAFKVEVNDKERNELEDDLRQLAAAEAAADEERKVAQEAARVPSLPVFEAAPVRRRPPAWMLGAAAAGLGVVVIGSWLALRPAPAPPAPAPPAAPAAPAAAAAPAAPVPAEPAAAPPAAAAPEVAPVAPLTHKRHHSSTKKATAPSTKKTTAPSTKKTTAPSTKKTTALSTKKTIQPTTKTKKRR